MSLNYPASIVMVMRAFFAIDLNNKAVIGRILEVQRRISLSGADVKHVEPENLHFTIKFLGEISDVQAQDLWRRVSDISVSPINITYKGIGSFPSPHRISVIWIGVDREGGEALRSLAHEVEKRLMGLVLGDTKPFQPHLTITRVKSGRNREGLLKVIEALRDVEFGKDTLTALKLKKSDLTPQGPVYTDIYTLRFQGV
ncbi:MAG: RNA 2',3'-cyclic phosphodiesterase [Nitrososphaerota archaeon]